MPIPYLFFLYSFVFCRYLWQSLFTMKGSPQQYKVENKRTPVLPISSIHFPSYIQLGGLYGSAINSPLCPGAADPAHGFLVDLNFVIGLQSTMYICRPLESVTPGKKTVIVEGTRRFLKLDCSIVGLCKERQSTKRAF